MGRRKPTALLEASGSTKHDPKRYAERLANEPKPDPVTAENSESIKPDYLTPIAASYWDECVALLEKSRVLTENDTIALAVLCEAYAEWRDASKKVRVEKSMLPAAHKRYNTAQAQLMKILSEFGMTPASRSKVQAAPKPPDENEFGKIASRRQRRREEEEEEEEEVG